MGYKLLNRTMCARMSCISYSCSSFIAHSLCFAFACSFNYIVGIGNMTEIRNGINATANVSRCFSAGIKRTNENCKNYLFHGIGLGNKDITNNLKQTNA